MRTFYFYRELENMYEEELNDIYGMVSVCGYEYEAGHLLRNTDEIGFRCGVSDWSSEHYEEMRDCDLTEEEQNYYGLSNTAVVYCHKNEVDE